MRERARHCSVFLDEFKYLLSVTAVNALGAIRDKGCNILLAHQSLGDFANCGSDLSESAVRTTILDTTPIKWLYRPADQDTASWVSDQTGRILVATQTVETVRNPELSESLSDVRSVGETERNLYDVNTVMSLPKGCAVCIGAGIPKLARATAIRVDKVDHRPTPAQVTEPVGIDLLERLPAQSDAEDEYDGPAEPLLDQDPETRLLRFLFEETWTHIDIIKDLLADVEEAEWTEMLSALADGNSIRSDELKIGSSSTGEYWGITRKGIDEYQVMSGISAERPAFIKRMLNPRSILHRLDLQRLRLAAERAGWCQWQMPRPSQADGEKSDLSRCDSVTAGQCPGCDRGRTQYQTERRLREDICRASRSAATGTLGHGVLSESGSEDYQVAGKRMYREIEEVEFEGSVVAVGDEHRAVFRFFTYDDDWTDNRVTGKHVGFGLKLPKGYR